MNDRRSLLVGGVSLVPGRLKFGGKAILMARNEIESKLVEFGYLKKAPFETVSLVIRYGDRENLNPEFNEIDSKNSELPVAVVLNMEQLKLLSMEQLAEKFRITIIEVLCDVAANFDLPYQFLDDMRR